MEAIRVLGLPALTLSILFFGASSSGWAGFKRINQPNPADPMAVHIYQLDNGLTVYLTENHQTPRFYAEIAVRAGSKHDPAESTGLAHYLEHMLFKGTKRIGTLDDAKEAPHLQRITDLYEKHFSETDPAKRKEIYAEINTESQLAAQYAIPNELDKLYKAMGGTDINAHTSNEETVYQVGLPANRLRQWAMIEAERFREPVFRLFQPELEAVYEEKNQTLDSKAAIIQFAVGKMLFKVHPYGQQTTIGEIEHLKNPSLRHMYRFFETYYVPNNMAICLSGDISIPDTIRLIDEHFSVWKSKELPAARHWEEKPLRGVERLTVKYQGEEYVLLAFRTVPENHPDSESLAVFDMTLDNETAGLINLNLVQDLKVRQAGSGPLMLNDYGAQYFWGVPKRGQSLADVEKLLLDQIEFVKKGEFDEWILPAIIADFKKTQKTALESDETRVAQMRNAFIRLEDWDHEVAKMSRLEKVQKADVVRVANKYFGTNYVAGYRVDAQHEVPHIEKPAFDPITIDPKRESSFFKEITALQVNPIEPSYLVAGKDYEISDLREGVTLYYTRNPINDLFSFSVILDAGRRHEKKLHAAALLLEKSGAARLSSEDLQKQWYRLGTEFNINAGVDQTVITLAGLDENFGASLALLGDLLHRPTADQETLDELIKIILVQREDAKKDFRTISSALADFNRYGKNSDYLQMLPDAGIRQLKLTELHQLTKGLLKYKHRIGYAGSLPPAQLKEILQKTFVIDGSLLDPPAYVFREVRQPAKSEVFFFDKQMAQAQIRIDLGDQDYDEKLIPAIQLYNEYFAGGMAGVVFQELREARALAYSANAHYVPGKRKGDQNLMVGAMSCQADKTAESLEAFINLFENLPVSPGRFEEARNSLLNQYRTSKLSFREILPSVRSWELLELSGDPRKWRFEQIQNAEMTLMTDFHNQHLKGRPKLISVVGDKSRIAIDRLAKIGQVTEVKLTDLFVF